MTPDEFHEKYMGWGKDVDGVAGIQCVDLFKEFLRLIGVQNWAAAIGGDGYADNIWFNQSRWSEWLTPVSRGQFKNGDIVLFPHARRGGTTHPSSHVCFWYDGKEFGTNQSSDRKACDKSTKWTDALGGLRWKGWEKKMELKDGFQEITISGVKVTAYRSAHLLGLINAGGLKRLDQIDMDGILIYERSGNDLFDASGTVYGPRICLNGQVDEPEDSKNYLYYAILKDGSLSFGDWDGKYKDPSGYQCMFSPKAIYADGVLKYAPQYGIKAISEAVWQTYVAHMSDGSFVKGVSKGSIKASALWDGLKAYGADSLAIMDGGSGGIGSAQQRYWDGSKAVDAQTSGRAVGDILVFYEPASETEKPADTSGSTKDDYQSMYQEKCAELAALQAKYEALLEQYEALQKTNAENLETVTTLKTDYEARIEKAIKALKGEE